MNTTTMLFLYSDPAMYMSPGRTYARVGIRDPHPYVHIRGRIFFLAPWPLYVRVHATCAPLLRHVRTSTTTRARLYYDTCAPLHPPVYMYVHVRDQNDNATYASTRWVLTVRHFLAYEDVAGGSQKSGGESFCFFCPDALPCVRRCSWWVPAVRGKRFFAKYSGPSGGSQLSGGGIIIFRVIRRHFLAATVDPAVSPSTYSPRPMEVVP